MNADKLIDIITELRDTNSKIAKIAILENHKHNQAWKDYLVGVYDPFVTYGISGDTDSEEGRWDVENLKLCRSIDAGITSVTINKVYEGLIPSAGKMMKAKDISKIDPNSWKLAYPVLCNIKWDGHYTVMVKEEKSYCDCLCESDCDGTSESGCICDCDCESDLEHITSGGHHYRVVDGTYYINDKEVKLNKLPPNAYIAERVGGEGKLGDRKLVALKGPKDDKVSSGHSFRIFDVLSLSDYREGKSQTPYGKRINWDAHSIGRVCRNSEEVLRYARDVTRLGYEGIVVKAYDMKWRDSKSRQWDFCKYKPRPTADLICIKEVGGTGKYKGFIGSLLLQDSRGLQVNVGSGLTDIDRQAWGFYKNRVVEIEYEQVIDTYIQPVFLHVREDKTIDEID